jgi:hypothetical protein
VVRLRTRDLVALLVSVTTIACASIAGVRDQDPGGPGDGPTAGADGGGDGPTGLAATDIEVTPDKIDMGSVKCGTDVTAATTLSLHNKGAVDAPYKITVPDGSPFRVREAPSGTLKAGSTIALAFIAKATESGGAAADVLVEAGPLSRTVAVTATGSGPTLHILPSIADLGDVRAQSGGAMDVELRNDGDTTLSLTSFTGAANGFSMTWNGGTGQVLVQAGQSVKGTVSLDAGTIGTKPTTTFVPVIDGPTCGAPPSLVAKGNLVDRSVVFSTIDFDKQSCSTSPTVTQDIIVSNYAGQAISVTPAPLPANSKFTFASMAKINIDAAMGPTPTTGKITVGLKPIDSNLVVTMESLGFDVGGVPTPDGGTRSTTARVDVRGAILTATPNPFDGFRSADCTRSWFCGDTRSFTITNTGNDSVDVTYTNQRLAGPAAWQSSFPATIAPGAHSANMTFVPQGSCSDCDIKYAFVYKSGAGLCTPPAQMEFQGSTD